MANTGLNLSGHNKYKQDMKKARGWMLRVWKCSIYLKKKTYTETILCLDICMH